MADTAVTDSQWRSTEKEEAISKSELKQTTLMKENKAREEG